ncbi:MAG: hypothetical protein Q4F71_05850 [Paracoccus sp. (in: a-proteobacteria)]|nr:hypothetical protein [Paracoccus sp. (in: a-proteobacteria)]
MTRYTASEIIERIETLTEPRLETYLRLRIVQPVMSERGSYYREIDIARLRLVCDLEEDYALEGDALVMVLSLVDQLHGLRGDMEGLLAALAEQPGEVREAVGRHLRARTGR